ncbi:MAG: right-handed parallel beta-helix repeat-containing protein, partial [Clostridia bacterium]|nr:right-handed parallel beta-helix repeat-containing protein [Clostridia bacterium]
TDARADIKGYADYKKIHDYALDAMSWANAVGLVTGVTATELNPRGTATREQFAAIMHRFDTTVFEYGVAYEEPMQFSHYTEKEYPLVEDADFYVSASGSDSNDGSKSHPFRTFEKARDAVRTLNKAGERKVAFFAGEYGNLNNITFTAEDAGTAESPITYCAYGDGEVLFSNGIVIKNSDFRKIDASDEYLFKEKNFGSIRKVDLKGKVDEMNEKSLLFKGAGVCWEARFPDKSADGNDGYFTDMTTTHDELASIELQLALPKVVEGFRTIEGMKATGFLRTGWLVDTFVVKSYDKDTHILTFDFEKSSFGNGYSLDQFVLAYEGRMHDTIFFSNLSDQLDADGEYWFDPSTKVLYVYNPQGDYAIPTSGTFITLGSGADYLNFVGLSFNCSGATAIESAGCHVTFDRLNVKNVSGSRALNCVGNNITVKNSEFSNFVDTGISIRGNLNVKLLEECHNVIDNNYLHDFSLPEYWAQGIEINSCVGAVVSHNELVNGAHAGIRFNSSIDTVIEYNVFDNMLFSAAATTEIYTWSGNAYRSNVVRYNMIKNITDGARYGIYFDGCDGNIAYGNILYDAGLTNVVLNGGRDNDFHDNVLIFPDGGSYRTVNDYVYFSETDEERIEHGSSGKSNIESVIPKEGAPGYELWKARWPEMYAFSYDLAAYGKTECYLTTVNYFSRNAVIGGSAAADKSVFPFLVSEDEHDYTVAENPLFVCPAIGDYRIRDDADFFKIPVEEIGRY